MTQIKLSNDQIYISNEKNKYFILTFFINNIQRIHKLFLLLIFKESINYPKKFKFNLDIHKKDIFFSFTLMKENT